MAAESSKRSDLIDVSYQQLHTILCGRHEGTSPDQINDFLTPRISQLKSISEPFGKPSSASRKKIESGSVELPDKVVVRVEDADKDFVFAISSRFQIDEIQALILFRSFLFNEGLGDATMTEELLEAITPFYFEQRLHILRVLIPLLRGDENEILQKIIPDPRQFVSSLIAEYVRKSKEGASSDDPRTASKWAKQNLKEQLILLEVLFATMWGYVACSGPLVVEIYEAAYSTNLGAVQQNSTLLLDEEGLQLQQDCAALWILITVEVLELETLSEPEAVQISNEPANKDLYIADSESLKRIHELVISNAHSHYACAYLGWAFVLSRLRAAASGLKEMPPNFHSFFESLDGQPGRSYSKDREPIDQLMVQTCLDPGVGLFGLIHSLLTYSPLFVTAISYKTGSTVTDPNGLAFRSVLKGLLMALVELVPVELIPDFDGLVQVWIALFGRSESESISGICMQFWQADWPRGIARRAIFDVARSRFPIQLKPLIRLLRSMTGSGFLDTDELSTADHSNEGMGLTTDRDTCDRHVFYYMDKLPTFSQVIPLGACTGAHAQYERQQERYSSSSTGGLTYLNLHPIHLPGGSILPARTPGRLLSGDNGDFIVVSWQHEHSGWKLVLEVLTDYVNRRRKYTGFGGGYHNVSCAKKSSNQVTTLLLEDIGVEIPPAGDDELITDCFDLIRSLIQDNPVQAEQLVQAMESENGVVSADLDETAPPNVVQLTTMILEEALSRTHTAARDASHARLITSAMSVLSALLVLPAHSKRVWLYIRSTTAMFGSERNHGFASVALAAERVTGHYTMTLALLHLVQQLFSEAATSIVPDNSRLMQVKEEVLLRAVRFVHTEVWVEHLGWKYAQLGDRFEIGRRISSLYSNILTNAPPSLEKRPFPTLSQAIVDVLLLKATTAAINPLVSAVCSGGQIVSKLYDTRRISEARRLIFLLASHLHLMSQILLCKQKSSMATSSCLLEQALCSRISGIAIPMEGSRFKLDPIDVLASYVRHRDLGEEVPREAMWVLYHLCTTLSVSQPSPPTIIGHLSNPEATVASLVRIIQHPYDDLNLRNAVWSFIALAVDKEPALASLFATGRFRAPPELKGKGKAKLVEDSAENSKTTSALEVARDVLVNWKAMWEMNPQLLSSVVRFLYAVWQHGLEHKAIIEDIRENKAFWEQVVALACEESTPAPDYQVECFISVEGTNPSNLDDAVASHAYRTMAKAYAIHILTLDLNIHFQSHPRDAVPSKPTSYTQLEGHLKQEDQMTDLLSEAASNSYEPSLHDHLTELLDAQFPGTSIELLERPEPIQARTFGDDFTFSLSLLQTRLHAFASLPTNEDYMENTDLAQRQLCSINLNLSLSHSQSFLAEAWQSLLRRASPYLRGDVSIRPTMLSIAANVSYGISQEQRSGDMMAIIHGTRLSLLLSMLELVWFSSSEKPNEVKAFIDVIRNVHGISLNEAQSPSRSFMGSLTVPFHQSLLQLVYFCARQARSILPRPKATTAEQRLDISAMIESTLTMVVDALSIVFDSASSRNDIELDRDMELLVAVFEQCTRQDINASSTSWLARFQERDVLQASLNLFTRIDLVGLADLPLLLSRKNPLYTPHILTFHMALASIPSAAQRLASGGILAAYSNNPIGAAASSGLIDTAIPEVPGERSPAHRIYCTMLSIVAGILTALGRQSHYFDAEASGLLQLYDGQISRTLSWTIGDSLSFALLEEMEQTVHVFSTLASNAPSPSNIHPAVEKVLRTFTERALLLLQQLNYAVTHPNHLASLIEPTTSEERIQLDKESAISDPLKRPLIAQLIHRLFRLSSNLLSTLISISRADTVLLQDQEDWPVQEAWLVPHSKIVLGEPASLGTLLELGNSTLDILRELTGRPAGESLMRTPSGSDSLNVREGVETARYNLEGILTYAITQLAMWLCKPEFDGGAGDTDGEEQMMDERRPPRPSASLAGRLRRGMTVEMAADLQSLLTKTQPMIAKSDTVLGKGRIDMIGILSNFLRERIVAPV
ncbi:hypothetical protein BDN71DRAFT_1384838 [Pleurotus eryngii]|uniref:Nucleoporin NUP188 n=1 Tax=Pleurotus eryngii TaxID=5323 RepID=A0A9P6DIF8_PLEER|nr:hypothetical protein BDN71DRAFT_1384838 [Pleurotus eryngii]